MRLPTSLPGHTHAAAFVHVSHLMGVDVHHQLHIGGNTNLVAAGTRTTQATPFAPPWTIQTGKPTGYPTGVHGPFL